MVAVVFWHGFRIFSQMKRRVEEGSALELDFGKLDSVSGCVPVAVQRIDTRDVVLVAYTNEAAMRVAFAKRRLVLWSTSRNALWEKGDTSGARFELVEAYVNCEQNSLLYLVRPAAESKAPGMCHTSNSRGEPRNCFYRKIDMDTMVLTNVDP